LGKVSKKYLFPNKLFDDCSLLIGTISAAMKNYESTDKLAEFSSEDLQEFAQAFKVYSTLYQEKSTSKT
jgi:hypothetical protein